MGLSQYKRKSQYMEHPKLYRKDNTREPPFRSQVMKNTFTARFGRAGQPPSTAPRCTSWPGGTTPLAHSFFGPKHVEVRSSRQNSQGPRGTQQDIRFLYQSPPPLRAPYCRDAKQPRRRPQENEVMKLEKGHELIG